MLIHARTFALGTAALCAGVLAAGCEDFTSATDLNPEGPPRIRQVFLQEMVTNPDTGAVRSVMALAFGSHEQFAQDFPGDDREVRTGSLASGSMNKLRFVVDELLVGNYLEHIQCRDGSYQPVPVGATPDDVAACSVQNDILEATCTGRYMMCLDPEGRPIGVMDEDENGSADDTRFIEGAVRVTCNDGAIDVPLSLSGSFWQPSGNQQVPASGGYNAVGPAVVLVPAIGMPSSSTCTVVFDDSVRDKDGNRVCAAAEGSLTGACTPGDTSLVQWGTEAIRVTGSQPQTGAEGVPATGADAIIRVLFNTSVLADGQRNVDPSAFVLLEDGVARTGLTARLAMNSTTNVEVTVPGGYVPEAEYELQITSNLKDLFEIGAPAGLRITFTTAPQAAN